MKRKLLSSSLLLLTIVFVGKSQGYGVKGGISKSFSSSAASSSASSFSSSSSFSVNSPLDVNNLTNDLTGSSSFATASAQADASGASAKAGATTGAGIQPGSGSLAVSGSSTGSGILPGLLPGASISGPSAGSGIVPSSGYSSGTAGAGSLSVAGSGSISGSTAGSIAGSKESSVPSSPGYLSGLLSGSRVLSGSSSETGSSASGVYLGAGITHPLPSVAVSSPAGKHSSGHYGSSAVNTGYVNTGNSATSNYGAHSDSSHSNFGVKGECCRGPFPGPTGSIHDSKPASAANDRPAFVHVVETPVTPSPSFVNIHNTHTDAGDSGLSYNLIISLPGAKGSIHDGIPASHVGSYYAAGGSSYNSASSSHGSHVAITPVVAPSINVIGSLPGTSGSIHQSIPAIHQNIPVGTTNSDKLSITGEVISSLPGKPGSIHDSKPAYGHSSGSSGSYSGASYAQGAIVGSGCHGASCIPPATVHPSSGSGDSFSSGYHQDGSHNKKKGNIEIFINPVPSIPYPVLPNKPDYSGSGGVKPAPTNVQVCSGPFCKPAGPSSGSYSGSSSNSYSGSSGSSYSGTLGGSGDSYSGSLGESHPSSHSGCSGTSCKGNGAISSGYNSGFASGSSSGSSYDQHTSSIAIDLSNPKPQCPGGYCDTKDDKPDFHTDSSLLGPIIPSKDLVAPVSNHQDIPDCSSGYSCGSNKEKPSSASGPQLIPSGTPQLEVPACTGIECGASKIQTGYPTSSTGNSYHASAADSASSSESYSSGIDLTGTSEGTYHQKPICSGSNCGEILPASGSSSYSGSTSGSKYHGHSTSTGIDLSVTADKSSCSGSYCADKSSSAIGLSHGVKKPTFDKVAQSIDIRIPSIYQEGEDSIAGPGTGNLPIEHSPSVSYGNHGLHSGSDNSGSVSGLYVSPVIGSGHIKSNGFATGDVVIQKSEGTEYHDVAKPSSPCSGYHCGTNKHGTNAGALSDSFSTGTSGSSSVGNHASGSGGISGGYSGSSGDSTGSNVGTTSGGTSGAIYSSSSGSYAGSQSGANSGIQFGLGVEKGCFGGNCGGHSSGQGLPGFGGNLGGSSSFSSSNSGSFGGVKGGSISYSTAGSSSSGLTPLSHLIRPVGLDGALSKAGALAKAGAFSGSASFSKSESSASSSAYSSSFASSGAVAY